MVLALVKGKTFYNRYGFVDRVLDLRLKDLREQKINDEEVYNIVDHFLKHEKKLEEFEFVQQILKRDANYADFATLIYYVCSTSHPLLSNESFVYFRKWFQRRLNGMFQEDHYTRPVSTNQYTFELTSIDADRYNLRIHSPLRGAGRTRRRSKRNRSKRKILSSANGGRTANR
jgi:hypothetical protein